jgi:hypothetical protein
MPFELEEFTKVRVLDVRTLAAKDRAPDDPPGAQLLLRATLPTGALSMLDGALASWLYRKAGSGAKQPSLDGIEGVERTSIGEHVKRLPWVYEQTGNTVEIDRGLGGRQSNLLLDDCRAHRLSITPQESGAVWQWTLDIPGLSDETRGKLTGLKATDIQMKMRAPSADDVQGDIEDELKPKRGRGRPAKTDATDEFVRRNQAAAAGAH